MSDNMRARFLILLCLLILALSAPSDTLASQYQLTHLQPQYQLSEQEMGVYRLVTPDVNESITVSNAFSLFDISAPIIPEIDGIFFVNSGNKTFQMDSRDGSMWYADFDHLWNAVGAVEVPTPASCETRAIDFLTANNLLPAGAVVTDVSPSNSTAFNLETEDTLFKTLHYQVTFGFELEGVPVTGPGAQIAVLIGGGGNIIGFDWNWREVVLHTTIPLIEYDSLLGVYGISPEDVTKQALTYYAGPDDEHEDFLFPAYEISMIGTFGDQECEVLPVLPATEFSPMVNIVTPTDQSSFSLGTEIDFNCTVTNGTGPFTYTWTSDYDGILSDEQAFTNDALAVIEKVYNASETASHGLLPHIITVTVTDSNGMICRDFIELTIVGSNPLVSGEIVLIAVLGGLAIIAIILTRRRKGGMCMLMLFLVLLAFVGIPMLTVASTSSSDSSFTPEMSIPVYVQLEDTINEVGIEWVGASAHPPLHNTATNIGAFYGFMTSYGYSPEFNYGETSAWEEDFKTLANGGTDYKFVERVDIVYYQDHGNPDGVAFSSNQDDDWMWPGDCSWGEGDLEWIIFDACAPLAWENGEQVNVFDRWNMVFGGLHMVCSFATGSSNVQTRGLQFAWHLSYGYSIMHSWFIACALTQDWTCAAAVLYPSKSPDPHNPQLDDCSNDHAHGFGYVSTDPDPGEWLWLVYVVNPC
ncbi:MAG: DUF6345 domain-containing protein [Candidatus Thorarchaeota archaeon]